LRSLLMPLIIRLPRPRPRRGVRPAVGYLHLRPQDGQEPRRRPIYHHDPCPGRWPRRQRGRDPRRHPDLRVARPAHARTPRSPCWTGA